MRNDMCAESMPSQAKRMRAGGPSAAAGSDALPAPFRIVVVDDSLLLRYRVKHVFLKEEGLSVVGEAENGLDGVRLVRELRPDLVVMDIKMPLMDGVEATLQIKAEHPDTVVVGLSSLKDREILSQFMNAGAAALVDKSRDWRFLVEAVRRCLAARRLPAG